MKNAHRHRSRGQFVLPRNSSLSIWLTASALFAALLGAQICRAQAPSTSLTTWAVTIVLPPRVVAGQPVTFSVLGVDGRLASDVMVDLGNGLHATTDQTGHATFTATGSGSISPVLILAKASGSSAATLIDPAPAANSHTKADIASVVSLRDRFSICGAGVATNASFVRINGDPALVLAASPECLVILPGPKATPGPANISISASDASPIAATVLVSLDLEAPAPALLPGKKGQLLVHVRGSIERLGVFVENESPGVLQFQKGQSQELVTSGGPQNIAPLKVEAITSGDFSFHARLLPSPDIQAAQRYLLAAQTLAPKESQRALKELAARLARHPRDYIAVRHELDRILAQTIPGDLRTVIDAARSAL